VDARWILGHGLPLCLSQAGAGGGGAESCLACFDARAEARLQRAKSTADVLKARNDFSGLLDDLDTLVIIVNNALGTT